MIRKAKKEDLAEIMEIYAYARQLMKDRGNPTQWGEEYPPRDLIEEDIENEVCYVVQQDGKLGGVFYFKVEEDESYKSIFEGEWLNDEEYGVIHRIASVGSGVFSEALKMCEEKCDNLRIDTHDDNFVMQKILDKNGFEYCGRITFEDGSERLAYQKIIRK